MLFRRFSVVRSAVLGLLVTLTIAQSGCALMKAKAHQAEKKKHASEFSCGEHMPPSRPL
ncbi:MAG TPA: hypothetical protein VFG20_13135 [Planctomycetaceae bacterium]|nr:hypothetical protein [Planctomycetaceae bacterium]